MAHLTRLFGVFVTILITFHEFVQAAPETSIETKRSWGPTVEGQSLSIKTEKHAYAPGVPITLDVRLRNVSHEDVTVVGGFPTSTYRVSIVFEDKDDVPLTLWRDGAVHPARADAGVYRLKPGQERRTEIELDRLF